MNAEQKLTRGLTCLIERDGETLFTSKKSGIAPLIDLIDGKTDVKGATAFDKIVGKAAALLYALFGVKKVCAEVVSQDGLTVLKKYGIICEYSVLARHIINRRGDGLCPMEQAVEGIDEPKEAAEAVRKKLIELSK